MTGQEMTRAEWLAKHQGEYLGTIAEVWSCDDDYCGCSQAQVTDIYRNAVVPNWRVPITVWEGEFYTEHEPGAAADLVAYRRALRESDPEREAAIRWQQGIDYEMGAENGAG